jgi:predicted Ser/Thr protein kinase
MFKNMKAQTCELKQNITVKQEIRKTLLGAVFLGTVEVTNGVKREREEVVVKVSRVDQGTKKVRSNSCENPLLEIKALSNIPPHKNITAMKDSWEAGSQTHVLVMEFMAGGDLFDCVN